MMMKNIWDAVNELNGELTGCCEYLVTTGLLWSGSADMNECIEVGAFRHIMGDDAWVVLCTTREFNECVAEMSDWLPPGWKLEDYAPNIKTEEEIQAMAKYKGEADRVLLSRGGKSGLTIKPDETVTHDGKVYQIGDYYAGEDGRIGALKAFKSSEEYPFVLHIKEHLGSTSWPCVSLTAVDGSFGTIEDAPIELEDGEWYMCEVLGGDRFIKTCLFRSGSKWVDSEVGSVGITAKPLYKMVKA